MDRTLLPLPYAKDALEPYMTGLTLELHYGRHHRGYLEQLIDLVDGRPEEKLSLEALIRTAHGRLFDLASQVWNHSFFWRSLRAPGGAGPSGALLAAIERDLGGLAALERQLADAVTGHFGSGWVWLMLDGRHLRVRATHDAMNPLRSGCTPLLAIDAWEHAYYLDYFDGRARYAAAVVEHLLDWDFAAENLERAGVTGGHVVDGPRRDPNWMIDHSQEERR
jgi:Fe-Mn family superoxide dismutase